MIKWDLNLVSPLLYVAPVGEGGAAVVETEGIEEAVDVERDAVFGDPICGKLSRTMSLCMAASM